MRIYSWLLTALFVLFVFIPAQASGLPEAESNATRILDELRQYDARNAGLQLEWEKEAAHIESLQPVSTELMISQEAAWPLAAKHAWMKYNRQQKTVEALEAFARVYDLSPTFWSEGRAQVADNGKSEAALQALRLAEANALGNAGKAIVDRITPSAVLSLLTHAPIAANAEKIAADNNGDLGKVKQLKQSDGTVFEARVRLQVKPAVANPYSAAAQARRVELKAARLELLRQYPVLAGSLLSWESKLLASKPNAETVTEKKLTTFTGLISEGQLRVTKEIADRELPGLDGGLFQLQLFLRLPAGIAGDAAKLEITLKDRETNGTKRLNLQFNGLEGSATYVYQSFTPPIITLAAGATILTNSRLRVGETVIRLEAERPSVVALELKNGEIAAYSSGKLTRKMIYEGKIGQLQSISLVVPGLAAIDSIKLFDNGVLVLVENFNQDGQSGILLNSDWK